jgi:hypothetical protein
MLNKEIILLIISDSLKINNIKKRDNNIILDIIEFK